MRTKEIVIECKSRSEEFYLYALGDTHIGALNCAENELRRMVARIKKQTNAYWLGGGDYCRSLNAKILCKSGFKLWHDVIPGELVASFHAKTLVWEPLTGIYLTTNQPFKRMSNTTFTTRCTPDHGWLVQDGHRSRRDGQESSVTKIKTKNLKQGHRILIAAPMEDITTTKLTDKEAKLLAWLVTDGTHKTAGSIQASIFQSKEPYVTEIRNELGDYMTSEKAYDDGSLFHVRSSDLRAILDRLGISQNGIKAAMPGLVCSISQQARQAMFDAMLKAEGWYEGRWRFSQKPGPVLEAFQILATLLGERLSPAKPNKNGVMVCSVVRRSKHVTVTDLVIEDDGRESAWCPVTKSGSWVSLEDGQVTITGNCDAVILNDTKRFDPDTLPNWMLTGGAEKVRKNIKVMLAAQRTRFLQIVEPIRDKCIGMIEGNHEYAIMKHHNRDHQRSLCEFMGVDDLTDCAFLRLKFRRSYADKNPKSKSGKQSQTAIVRVFICHGHGGGRTSGAEPNRLYRLAADKEADVILTGHSHTFHIHPPIPMMFLQSRGKLLHEPLVYDKHVANWGAYVFTYKSGPSTYVSRANYPLRPMYTVEVKMRPFNKVYVGEHAVETPEIEMNEVRL